MSPAECKSGENVMKKQRKLWIYGSRFLWLSLPLVYLRLARHSDKLRVSWCECNPWGLNRVLALAME